MKPEYQILPDKNVIVFVLKGALTLDDYLQTWAEIYDHPDFRPNYHALWDLRNGSLGSLTTRDLFCVKDHLIENRPLRGDAYRIALVVNDDLNLGMSRLYQQISIALPNEFGIFADWDKALQYVDLEAGSL